MAVKMERERERERQTERERESVCVLGLWLHGREYDLGYGLTGLKETDEPWRRYALY